MVQDKKKCLTFIDLFAGAGGLGSASNAQDADLTREYSAVNPIMSRAKRRC